MDQIKHIILDQKLIVKVKTLTQIFHNIKNSFVESLSRNMKVSDP